MLEASTPLQHWGTTAQARADGGRRQSIAIDKLRREVEHDEATVMHDQTIFNVAIDAKREALQPDSGRAHRIRERRLEVQQAIEELVATGGQRRGEAILFRLAEAKAAAVAREAQERPGASMRLLRQELGEAQTELAANTSPQSVREHVEQLLAAWRG